MDHPVMFEPRHVAPDTHLLPAYLPVPRAGVLPVNAFVITAREPVLIDTGLLALREDFLRALASVIAPEELRWIWLTHMDPDHLGNLAPLLAAAPAARLVTNFLGMGKLGLLGHPVERVRMISAGETLDAGDRRLLAHAPPVFDAPETLTVFDSRTETLFSADAFGALLTEPAETAAAIAPEALRQGMVTWAHVDAPWLPSVRAGAFDEALDGIRRLRPATVLGSHLPPAAGMSEALLAHLGAARANAGAAAEAAAVEASLEAIEA